MAAPVLTLPTPNLGVIAATSAALLLSGGSCFLLAQLQHQKRRRAACTLTILMAALFVGIVAIAAMPTYAAEIMLNLQAFAAAPSPRMLPSAQPPPAAQ
jgi:heme/copper-type cytochrome/quinol oxidase subunit 3